MATYRLQVASPLGCSLSLTAEGDALVGLKLSSSAAAADTAGAGGHPLLREAARQLVEYFAGSRRSFDLPLRLEGTPFQQRVWAELQRIPYGSTVSYRELAQRIGQPRAMRAVGAANGRNPIGLIVPCHRVIAADGSLGGYTGGLSVKSWLLRHEAETMQAKEPASLVAAAC